MMILIFDVNIQKLYGLWIHFAWQSIALGWAKSLSYVLPLLGEGVVY